MPDNSPQSSDDILEIACLFMGFQPNDYWKKAVAKQHPEALAKAKHRLTQRELFSRISELKAVLANVPMPTLSYEQVQNRIAQLESQMNKGGQHG